MYKFRVCEKNYPNFCARLQSKFCLNFASSNRQVDSLSELCIQPRIWHKKWDSLRKYLWYCSVNFLLQVDNIHVYLSFRHTVFKRTTLFPNAPRSMVSFLSAQSNLDMIPEVHLTGVTTRGKSWPADARSVGYREHRIRAFTRCVNLKMK